MAIGAINSGIDTRIDSLGLDMQSLLRIILTQLTYQDPLKPVDNFEFISQLAQFTSLEQSRQLSEKVDSLLSLQSATQTIGLLGKEVGFQSESGLIDGKVTAVSFAGTQPALTVQTADGAYLTDIGLSQISQVR
ncbi:MULTISPECIES: flagellar hook assembly protein FlgD [Cupriavidus]|uniref:flagellar hook assembly protein FlgD n=1 Tax=Cupriavidus sp. WS TaxID=1312922 RepID=UPI00037A2279|nr:flagellar hook capping FlgD N-terminal domain-containing protein [Cupriavidus sp. WS]